MWVLEYNSGLLIAYKLTPAADFGARDLDKDIALTSDNSAPTGIWSDGMTMWVMDNTDRKLYAYKLTPAADFGARDSGKDISVTSDPDALVGMWSDGTTMWVVGTTSTLMGGQLTSEGKLYAHKFTPGADFGARDSGKDIALALDNASPTGIWSDGMTMWVADSAEDKIYAYYTPARFFQ